MLRLSLAILLSIGLLCVSVQAQNVIRVCYKGNTCDESQCDYYDLQDAVNAASSGDTIEVYEGNFAGAFVGCGPVTQAITIRGVCATCPGDNNDHHLVARSHKYKSMKHGKKLKPSKPVKPTMAPKKKSMTTVSDHDGDTCDIFISKDGVNVNAQANEDYGFLAGLVFCERGAGSTVENIKFICSPNTPSIANPQELGIGIYGLNSDQLVVTRNVFTNCLKGVVLDGTQYAVVSHNHFESRAVFQAVPVGAVAPEAHITAQFAELYASRHFSCNHVMLVERVSAAVSTSQAAYNVIERNQGSLTSVPGAGCTAFLLVGVPLPPNPPALPPITPPNYHVQYNFIRRNQVVGKGAGLSGNSSLVGVYISGNAQLNIVERNQFAALTHDAIFNTPVRASPFYYYQIRALGQTLRHNRFIQTVGSASVVLGDFGHVVVENEIHVTQTTAVGIDILPVAGNQYVDSNKISVPQTAAACDVRDAGQLSSHVENSGVIC